MPDVPVYDALRLVVQRSDSTKIQKDLILRRIAKAKRRGRFREELDRYQDAQWQFRIACARLMLGDYRWIGWEYRSPWAQMCWLNPEAFPVPKWNGQKNCKLMVLGEQGIGDEILFSQFIPKDIEVGFMCEDRLKTILERGLGITCYERDVGHERKAASEIITREGYTHYIAVADIPRIIGLSTTGEAFLEPDPQRVSELERYRGKVGVSWRGRNGKYDCSVFPKGLCLQYDIEWDEDPGEIPDIDLKDDLEGVLALCSVLERVVSVSTSVVHIAGAVGTPVDVVQAPWDTSVSRNQLNWRWGFTRRVPWYKSVRVYRNLNEYKAHQQDR
jgi:hypothetical protein